MKWSNDDCFEAASLFEIEEAFRELKYYEKSARRFCLGYFNVPDGWGVCLHTHYREPVVSVYKKGKLADSIEFRVKGGTIYFDSFSGYASKVDFYVLKQRFGGGYVPF